MPQIFVYLEACFLLFFKEFIYDFNTYRAKLNSLCNICYLGQVKFSLDKCIMAANLSQSKY